MITHIEIPIEEFGFHRNIYIFLFVLKNIIKNTINFGTIVLTIITEYICTLINSDFSFIICITLGMIYIMIALEETYHILMIVILKKSKTIKSLNIIRLNFFVFSFIGGASIHYSGKLKKSELLYISLAGPLMPLIVVLFLELLILLLNIWTKCDINFIAYSIFLSSIAPLLAFIPINSNGYISDGYRIYSFYKDYRLNLKECLQIFKYIIKTLWLFSIKKF